MRVCTRVLGWYDHGWRRVHKYTRTTVHSFDETSHPEESVFHGNRFTCCLSANCQAGERVVSGAHFIIMFATHNDLLWASGPFVSGRCSSARTSARAHTPKSGQPFRRPDGWINLASTLVPCAAPCRILRTPRAQFFATYSTRTHRRDHIV